MEDILINQLAELTERELKEGNISFFYTYLLSKRNGEKTLLAVKFHRFQLDKSLKRKLAALFVNCDCFFTYDTAIIDLSEQSHLIKRIQKQKEGL